MIRYRWLDRRDKARGVQVYHAVDLEGMRRELCDEVDAPPLISGARDGDLYCVACLRALIAGDGDA